MAKGTAAAGPDGLPDRPFALAGVGAGEEEVGDVGVSVQQDEADGGQREQSGLAGIADLAVVKSEDPERDPFEGFGEEWL